MDNILLQDPVRNAPEYLISSLLQLRRTLLDRETGRDGAGIDRPPLSAWISGEITLGPYESTILQRILDDAPHGVMMVRGGSGSGKSSTFQHIEHACTSAAQRLEWSNKYSFRRFLVMIDLQPTCETARTFLKGDQTRVNQAVEVLYHDLTAAIDGRLHKLLTDAAFCELVVDAANYQSSDERSTIFEGVQGRLAGALRKVGSSDTIEALTDIFAQFNAGDALLVRLLLLTQLARSLRETDGRPLVLVIDNVDPLPADVQNTVVTNLSSLVAAPLWRPFRIVILARLSTALHHKGQVRTVTIDHESPDPCHVVIYRLAWFFLFPETFSDFKRERDEVKDAITTRLFELWRHLVDPAGTVRRILSSMAGTNIRNGLDFARAWCLSDKLGADIYHRSILDDFRRDMRHLYGLQVVSELDATLGRVMDALFAPVEVRDMAIATATEGWDTPAAECAAKLAHAVVAVLRDFHLATEECDTGNARADHIRERVCRESQDIVLDTVGDLEFLQTSTAALQLALSSALRRCRDVWRDLEVPSSPELFMSALARKVPSAFAALGAVLQERNRSQIDLFERWVIASLRTAIGAPVTVVDTQRRFVAGSARAHDTVRKTILPYFAPRSSRFTAASVMVDPGATDRAFATNALNVFAIDHSNICPAALRILYLLARTKHGELTGQDLKNDLRTYLFSEVDVGTALLQMGGTETRLIFAGLSDSNDDVDHAFGPNEPVYLSAAGRGYYEELIAAPAYLQWAFRDCRETRFSQRDPAAAHGGTLAERVEATLRGFYVVVSDELRRFTKALDAAADTQASERLMSGIEITSQSVSADLFFRSYPQFIFALFSNCRRLKSEGDRHGLEKVRHVARRFRAQGYEWIETHAATEHLEPESSWQMALDLSEVDIDEINLD